MRVLENFILEVPYLFLRRVPYTWVVIVAFWTWPPYVSGIFAFLLLLGLALMLFQGYAWEQKIKREQQIRFRDHPQASFFFRARNLLLLLAACAILGWLLNGRFDLNAIQWAVLLAGIMITYKDHLLFGRGVVYLITDQGIAIRYVPGHIDYRFFFKYEEIKQVMHIEPTAKEELSWSIFSPMHKLEQGVLLLPCNPDGFTKRINKVLLVPTHINEFLQHLPSNLTVNAAA